MTYLPYSEIRPRDWEPEKKIREEFFLNGSVYERTCSRQDQVNSVSSGATTRET